MNVYNIIDYESDLIWLNQPTNIRSPTHWAQDVQWTSDKSRI